jgi:DNA invertase Pin-like site-specific DNA recombinase
MEQGVRFVACDMPTANELTVHIMAAVAEAERKAISSRTKAAMAVVKRKLKAGEEHVSSRTKQPITRLGNPNGLKVSRRDLGTAGLIAKADEFAARVLPTIREIQSSDVVSLARIAAELNARHILTARGSKWSPMSVKRVLDRSREPKSDAA